MIIQKKSKILTFENYLQIFVLSIPVFLITGPFLPDLFLSLSIILFLTYLVLRKKLDYLNHKIFFIFLIFYFILIVSSLLSDYPNKSLITSFGYFRFGIFIFLVSFLIDKKKDYFIRKIFFVLTIIFIILFFDAIFQKFTGKNILGVTAPYGRITSLFGDDVKLGGYIARITPLLIATIVYLKLNRSLIFFIFFISLFLTFISGERTSFLMLSMFLTGFIIFSNIPLKLKFLYFCLPFFISITLLLNQEIRHRVFTSTLNQININNEKPFYKTIDKNGTLVVVHRDSTVLPRIYQMYFKTSVKIFKDNILFGSGPRTYPYKSKEEKYYTVSNHEGWIEFVKKHNKEKINEIYEIHKDQINRISKLQKYLDLKENINLINDKKYSDWLKGYGLSHIYFSERIKDKKWLKGLGVLDEKLDGFTNISGVNNHPHNSYLQLLSETGLAGILFILTLWFFCIFKLFSKLEFYLKCLLLGLIINLFPFMFSGNFFNGWLSILYFYPIGFLLKNRKDIEKSNEVF